jgi:hypothetical protein
MGEKKIQPLSDGSSPTGSGPDIPTQPEPTADAPARGHFSGPIQRPIPAPVNRSAETIKPAEQDNEPAERHDEPPGEAVEAPHEPEAQLPPVPPEPAAEHHEPPVTPLPDVHHDIDFDPLKDEPEDADEAEKLKPAFGPGNGIVENLHTGQAQPGMMQEDPFKPDEPGTTPWAAMPMGKKKITRKKLLLFGIPVLVLAVSLLAVLYMGNVISLGEFKSIRYENNKGDNYKLSFYGRYRVNKLQSGQNQLVSKVVKDGKFPVTMLISSGEDNGAYDKFKGCTGYTQVFSTRNEPLSQDIAVCSSLVSGTATSEARDSVYVAAFRHENVTHLITISQDLSEANITNKATADAALKKFGLGPYNEDLKKIVGSIQVKK